MTINRSNAQGVAARDLAFLTGSYGKIRFSINERRNRLWVAVQYYLRIVYLHNALDVVDLVEIRHVFDEI